MRYATGTAHFFQDFQQVQAIATAVEQPVEVDRGLFDPNPDGQTQAGRFVLLLPPARADQVHQAVRQGLERTASYSGTDWPVTRGRVEELAHTHASQREAALAKALIQGDKQVRRRDRLQKTLTSFIAPSCSLGGVAADQARQVGPNQSAAAGVLRERNSSTRSRSARARSATAHHSSQGIYGSPASRSRRSSCSTMARQGQPSSRRRQLSPNHDARLCRRQVCKFGPSPGTPCLRRPAAEPSRPGPIRRDA